MNKYILILISAIFALQLSAGISSIGSDPSQPFLPDTTESITVTYVDNFAMKAVGGNKLAIPVKNRKNRVSEHAATIKINADGVPQEIVDCAEMAASIWEGIVNKNSYFSIDVESTNTGNDLVTAVSY